LILRVWRPDHRAHLNVSFGNGTLDGFSFGVVTMTSRT
jgi:hypothetical protein